MLTRKVLNKLEGKFNNLDVDKKSSYPKAFMIGGAEGWIDAAVVIGSLSIVKGAVEVTKAIVKK